MSLTVIVDRAKSDSILQDKLFRFGTIISAHVKDVSTVNVLFEDVRDADDARRAMIQDGHIVVEDRLESTLSEKRHPSPRNNIPNQLGTVQFITGLLTGLCLGQLICLTRK
jgi:hypothetical protein